MWINLYISSVLVSCYCDKTWTNQLKVRNVLFCSIVLVHTLACCFWPYTTQNVVARVHSRESSSLHGSQKAKRRKGSRWGPNVPFDVMPSMSYLLSTCSHCLNISSLPSSTTGWGPRISHIRLGRHSRSKPKQLPSSLKCK
jgi:hypothetical protein